jgi:hypothetical protein
MTGKLNKWKLGFLFAGLCTVVILATVLTVAGQGTYSSGSYPSVSSASGSSASTPSTSSSDRAYCVGLGYLYRSAPGINNGQGFCQFGGNSWCDAHTFATGSCSPSSYGFSNPYGNYYPYYYSAYPYGQNYGGSINSCQDYGGSMQSIHTPYGDVNECVYPNGSPMNSYGPYDGYLGDNWYYYAYNYLNSP